MESSGRCRRTDGKRWRCSKAAIPNEKYCQTHMHRGCRRGSRKLVESETPNLNLTLPTPASPIINAAKKEDPSNNAEEDPSAVKKEAAGEVMRKEQECLDQARRCRRTDGKRWRCTKEVVGEGHKYCANHMYRGVKKHCHYTTPNPYAFVKRDLKLPFAFHSNPSSP